MTTHIRVFYLDDRLSNGECHLNWIGIDTVWQHFDERLREPRIHFTGRN
jgi:hypothetical protein